MAAAKMTSSFMLLPSAFPPQVRRAWAAENEKWLFGIINVFGMFTCRWVILLGIIQLSLSTVNLQGQNIEEARRMRNEAYELSRQGRNQDALSFGTRALAIFEKNLGIHHPVTENLRVNIAEIYKKNGNYTKAQDLFEQTINGIPVDESLDENGYESDTVLALTGLASVFHLMGDYPKSCELYERLLTIRKKLYTSDHERLADSMHNLSVARLLLGDFGKAIQFNDQALSMRERLYGYKGFKTGISLNNKAEIYMDLGQYDAALEPTIKELEIMQAIWPDGNNNVALVMAGLAVIYVKLNQAPEAVTLLEQALVLIEKANGMEHRNVATVLNNLAYAYGKSGNFDRALDYLRRTLTIRKRTLGIEHPLTAESFYALGQIYEQKNDYARASEAFLAALGMQERVLGPNHRDTAATNKSLAEVSYLTEDLVAAKSYAIRNLTARSRLLQAVLSLDERSRLSWQVENPPYQFATILGAESIAELLLREKGVVLDSLAEDRALALATGSSGEGGAIIQNIKSLQSRLSKIAFEKDKEMEVAKMQDEIGQLQRELTSKYLGRDRQRFSAGLTMADIVPALAGGGVLVDFISFNDPKLKEDKGACLGAIITGEDNKPVFVRIDGGAAVNRAIDTLRAAINQGNAAEVEAQTKLLSEKLWAPIAAKIPKGARRLFLCPDSNLNFLSFAALLDGDGRFIAEKYPISYIGSARDLAKKPSNTISKSMAIFANPQFDASGKNSKTIEMVAMRSAEADVFGSIALPLLPGTEAEAQSLGSIATESGWKVKSALGKDATELSVRNAKKPGVLHLATHGFYLNSFTPPGPEGSRGMSVVGVKETAEEKKKNEKGVDPMRASGVALTGAQITLSSWSQRKAPDPESDGVLTAEEVGALRLDGTWMVVLSACETGVGEARSGEGVFGLRRAFMIAGAENLLMTLWPVADETTAKIMTDFYKEAFASGDAPGSLAKVQRDWLVKLRNERGLLAAVREAGPFAMVTMTNPNAQREFVVAQNNEEPARPAPLETTKSNLNAKQQSEVEELKKVQAEIKKLKEFLQMNIEGLNEEEKLHIQNSLLNVKNEPDNQSELEKVKAEKRGLLSYLLI